MAQGSLLVFGAGYLGGAALAAAKARGLSVAATSRDPERRVGLEADGITAVDPADATALAATVGQASAILVTAPPEGHGCPGAKVLLPALGKAQACPDWIGYVSSTAVYGDRNGGWVFEDDALNAASLEGARRVRAETDWLDAGRGMGLTVQIFRLPAIYGPGRSVVDRLRDGTARIVRKPGQIFNRIYVEDAVAALFASMERPRPGAAYNLTDDAPSPVDVVMADAAQRMGLPQPPEVDWTDPSVSEGMRRFYLDCKRISNARAKAELDWRPAHPTWREGLEAILASR
ncbi:NAD-dependent epimerase/dehydratase family protein [Brevundimonas sp.]|uniref:NAD-dependent epimerase/dehydratase family protein n=1 Tax=Brevundimonas sp. TaxID=1871086 RepID=UPI00263031D0|nr:NAD-dependent epimerase/dehydratase family protein [Brevundimonas sp.]